MASRNGPGERRPSSGRSKRSDTRKLQLIYLVIGLIVVLSMVLAMLPLGR